MDGIFRKFVETLAQSPDQETLQGLMDYTASAFDLGYFAYLHAACDTPEQMSLISNYPGDWTARYLAQGYDRIDPVVSSAKRGYDPFVWGLGEWHKVLVKPEIALMEEASAFGICCGFTFPIDDPRSSFAAVTFAADYHYDHFRGRFAVHRDLLKLMAYAFHVEARNVLAPKRAIAGVLLTAREFECLKWAARGKSAWDTGRIIGISRRTVAFHLDNAKVKLGVRTIQQAVALLAASRRTQR